MSLPLCVAFVITYCSQADDAVAEILAGTWVEQFDTELMNLAATHKLRSRIWETFERTPSSSCSV